MEKIGPIVGTIELITPFPKFLLFLFIRYQKKLQEGEEQIRHQHKKL